MAVTKIAKARGRANLLGCIVQLVALPLVVAMVGGLVMVALLVPEGGEIFVFAGVGLCFPLGMVGVLVPVMALLIRRRASWLDPIFAFVGPGKQTSVIGRGWAGEVEGRQVNAWFNKGPQIEVYVAADTRASAGVGQDNRVARLASGLTGRELVDMDGLVAGGPDQEWVERWLAEDGVRDALQVLLEEDGHSLRSVAVLPDSVRFLARYLSTDQLGEAAAKGWVAALQLCAEAAERVGPPAEPRSPGFGSGLRTSRGSLPLFLGIVFGALGLMLFVSGGTALLTLLFVLD